jgi:hypothetical protein
MKRKHKFEPGDIVRVKKTKDENPLWTTENLLVLKNELVADERKRIVIVRHPLLGESGYDYSDLYHV